MPPFMQIVLPLDTRINSSKSMIQQLPKSKWPVRAMPAKEVDVPAVRMSDRAMPARTIQPGKEHARLVVADITSYLSIRHMSSLSNNKVLGTLCSSKVEASK
jgi:hypothetical protein